MLSGTGLSGGTNGVYTLTDWQGAITGDLDALSFAPATGAPGSVTTTTFALSDLSRGFGTPTTDDATTVTDTDAVAPTMQDILWHNSNGDVELWNSNGSGGLVSNGDATGATLMGSARYGAGMVNGRRRDQGHEADVADCLEMPQPDVGRSEAGKC